MSYAPAAPASGPLHATLRVRTEQLRLALLWLTGVAGAFVFIEPSPYEIVSLLTIFVFVVTGIGFANALVPMVALIMFNCCGYTIAAIPVLGEPKTLQWVLISWYMAATAIFFAAMLTTNTERRIALLVRGYVIGGLIATAAGIIGYFHLMPKSDFLLLYGRARGTFNDPNVLGAFLVFPMLISLQRILSGSPREILRGGLVFAALAFGLLLSFSRGAWGQFIATSVVMVALMFITSRSHAERLRLVTVAAIGTTLLVLVIAALLSTDKIGALFTERFAVEQSYDTGHFGRFGRHILGFMLSLDKPFGIGPLQFSHYFPEDPHNTYLNSLMSGGWLSGFCYLTLTLLTVVTGLRFAFVSTPWHHVYLAVYAAYLGIVGESFIIDSDHWRHYWLLVGVLWGLMAASRAYAARPRAGPHQPALAPASPGG